MRRNEGGRPEPDPLYWISFHAVERFVERILGVRFDTRPEMNARERAEAACAAAGSDICLIRAVIAVPAVCIAHAGGITQVNTSTFRANLQDGIVVTITEPSGEKPRRRMRIVGKTEGRRRTHREKRRMQRRNEDKT